MLKSRVTFWAVGVRPNLSVTFVVLLFLVDVAEGGVLGAAALLGVEVGAVPGGLLWCLASFAA